MTQLHYSSHENLATAVKARATRMVVAAVLQRCFIRSAGRAIKSRRVYTKKAASKQALTLRRAHPVLACAVGSLQRNGCLSSRATTTTTTTTRALLLLLEGTPRLAPKTEAKQAPSVVQQFADAIYQATRSISVRFDPFKGCSVALL